MSVVSFISDSINYAHAIIKLVLFICLHSCFDFSFFFFFYLFVLLCNPSWLKLTLEKEERDKNDEREREREIKFELRTVRKNLNYFEKSNLLIHF